MTYAKLLFMLIKMANGQWGENLIQQTRKEIEDMITHVDSEGVRHWLIGSHDLLEARFKNSDGERFGRISAGNAHARNYLIELEGGGQEQYTTINALLEAGWVLD